MTPEILAMFHRITAEITALHGEPSVLADQPTDRFREGREMVTACWFLDGANHGLKIYEGRSGIEILTWAHTGAFASALVQLRSIDAAEDMLRRILPPSFGISPAVPSVQ